MFTKLCRKDKFQKYWDWSCIYHGRSKQSIKRFHQNNHLRIQHAYSGELAIGRITSEISLLLER